MKKLDIDEQRVLDLYEVHETARVVAEILGCSKESIYRVLRKYGVQRTHRHPKAHRTSRITGCKKKYCWALVVMLRTQCAMSFTELVTTTGYPVSTVSNIIRGRCPDTKVVRLHKEDFDIEQMVHEYRDLGMTSYELGDKYGVDHTTISRWMRSSGIVIGKDNASSRQKCHGSGAKTLKSRCRERVERKLADDGGRLELVGYGEKLLLRCTVCGHEFEKAKGGYSHRFTCPECLAREAEERQRKKKYERQQQLEAAREWLLSTPRVCAECGETFFSEYERVLYCSNSCRNAARNRRQAESKKSRGVNSGSYRRRMRIVVSPDTYDRSVTLSSVYKKFGGRCCSCGRRTFRTSEYSPSRATLDHIIALANNGTHTWDNVQLLCSDCNSKKRDLGQMRLAI